MAGVVGYGNGYENGYGGGGEGENVVNGIKQEIVSSGSSLYEVEEDAVGDVDFGGLALEYVGY